MSEQNHSSSLSDSASPCPPKTPQELRSLREYQARLEFALRLGFAERLVRQVLGRLDADAPMNKVLEELLKLDSNMEAEQESWPSLVLPSSCVLLSAPNSHRPETPALHKPTGDSLRPIILDGSNLALSHGNKEVFSCQGIQLAVDWFLEHGHKEITAFVPAWRKELSRPNAPIKGQDILRRLEKEKIVVFTPSRRVQGRRVVCHYDRFIVKLAHESGGVIVSNDNYRDLANERPEWKKLIYERLLMYSFVNNKFMLPDDPLGRHGPSLDNFLRKRPIVLEHSKQPCPYGKKCTYGHKCKFRHLETEPQARCSAVEELHDQRSKNAAPVKSHSLPAGSRPEWGPALIHSTPRGQSDPNLRAPPCRNPKRGQNVVTRAGLASLPLLPDHSHRQDRRASPTCGMPPLARGRRCPEMDWELDPSLPSVVRGYGGTGGFGVTVAASDCSGERRESSWDRHRTDFSERDWAGRPESPLKDLKFQSPQNHSPRSPQNHCPQSSQSHCAQSAQNHGPHSPEDYRSQYFNRPQSPQNLYPHMLSHSFLYSSRSLMFAHSFCPEDTPSAALPPNLLLTTVRGWSNCPGDNCSVTSAMPGSSTVFTCEEGTLETRLHRRGSPVYRQESAGGWAGPQPHPPYPCHDRLACQDGPEDCQWALALSPRHPAYSHRCPVHSPVPGFGSAPDLSQYQDVRQKAFVDLCNIFPPDAVRLVMERSPHTADAQILAAAILAERSISGGRTFKDKS